MAEKLPATPPPAPGTAPAAVPVAAPKPPGSLPAAAPVPVAAKPPELFGGWRSGKVRKDGLAPGSAAAKQADLLKERQRSADRRRAAAKVRAASVVAPPLPPPHMPGPGAGGSTAPGPASIPGTLPPPGGVVLPVPFPGDGPEVLWSPKDLASLVGELVALTEELCQRSISDKCRKAKLPAELVREIERDARWLERSKEMVQAGGSVLIAQALNKSGVPVEVRPYLMVTIGALQIAIGQMKLLKRRDDLIAARAGGPSPVAAAAGGKAK